MTFFLAKIDLNWSEIGTGLGIAYFAFMQAWTARMQKKTNRRQIIAEQKLDENTLATRKAAQIIDVVRLQGNSHLEEQLQLGMVSSARLAAETGLPEHIALANVARKKFELHVRQQAQVQLLKEQQAAAAEKERQAIERAEAELAKK